MKYVFEVIIEAEQDVTVEYIGAILDSFERTKKNIVIRKKQK